MERISPTSCSGCAELSRRVAELEALNATLQARNATLEVRLAELLTRVEAGERTAKRQAAPFSKGSPKRKPKKPGRKAGSEHGTHGHRPVPAPEQIDEFLEAPLPEACPDCGGKLIETHTDTLYQEEIPVRPIRRRFTIHCGHCKDCGKARRGRHPLQTSEATGAAASQVGPDAQAAVVYLNKKAGLSHGKISEVFDQCFGIKLTRGAACQIVSRAAQRLRLAHDEVIEQIKKAEQLTPDETGWRIGGQTVWLHAWVAGNGATLYQVDPQRSADALEQVIGIHWSGSMTHDGFSSYDRFEDAAHQQCIDHALRRAQDLLRTQTGSDAEFPRGVLCLLREALGQRDRFLKEPPSEGDRTRVYDAFTEQLHEHTARFQANAENERFAKHLRNHIGHWFMFLLDNATPATNHRAEQALRTPIVNRKVWGGNRTYVGAHVQGVTSSVIETCKRTAHNVIAYLSNAFRGVVTPLFATPTPPTTTAIGR